MLSLLFQEDNNNIKCCWYSPSLFMKLERVAIQFFYIPSLLFLNTFLFSKIMVVLNIGILYMLPYKRTTWIPRWNDVEKVVSTSFQRGIHVVCL